MAQVTWSSIILISLGVLSLSVLTMTASLPTSKPEGSPPQTNGTNTANSTSTNTTVPVSPTIAASESRMVDVGRSNSTIFAQNATMSGNSTIGDNRDKKQYVSLGPGLSAPYNPFPNYIDPRLGGFTGPGTSASSCAYAFPNRRYSCYGLGRK